MHVLAGSHEIHVLLKINPTMVLILSEEQIRDGKDSEVCSGWRSPYGGAVATLLVRRPLGVWEQPSLFKISATFRASKMHLTFFCVCYFANC